MPDYALFDQGWFGASLSGTPTGTNAIEVYGVPNVSRNPQVINAQAYTPYGDVRPDGVGRVVAQFSSGSFVFKEFTVPSSGSTRPEVHPLLVCSGHSPSSILDKTGGVSGEDTGLRGNGTRTRFRFLTSYLPKSITSVTDGTQTATASGGTFGGDGTGTYDNATGYVDVTFGTAPTNGATISVTYVGGYTLVYEHSRNPASLDAANILVTRLSDDAAEEEVRSCTGARGNLTLSLSENDELRGEVVGRGVAAAPTVDTSPTSPTYTEGAKLVWDETCTVVFYRVTNSPADTDAFVGLIPAIGFDAGFEVQEPRGAPTPGYTPQAKLVPGRSTWTLTLPTLMADELALEEFFVDGAEFNLRGVLPGRAAATNKLGFTARCQITARGEPQVGFGGIEHVQYTLKVTYPGNAAAVTMGSLPRYNFQFVTTV